jgi:hypothetical protein
VVEIAPSKNQNIPRRVIGSDFKPLCKTVSISRGILLHRHGITNMAHLELDQLIWKDKCHSLRNLPEDAINILPPTLRSTRIEYEEKGARIDCSLLSTI